MDKNDSPTQILLKRLGSQPHQIAENLERDGYKGIKGDSQQCVLFNYLKDKGVDIQEVAPNWVVLNNGKREYFPPGFFEFLVDFDESDLYDYLVL